MDTRILWRNLNHGIQRWLPASLFIRWCGSFIPIKGKQHTNLFEQRNHSERSLTCLRLKSTSCCSLSCCWPHYKNDFVHLRTQSLNLDINYTPSIQFGNWFRGFSSCKSNIGWQQVDRKETTTRIDGICCSNHSRLLSLSPLGSASQCRTGRNRWMDFHKFNPPDSRKWRRRRHSLWEIRWRWWSWRSTQYGMLMMAGG